MSVWEAFEGSRPLEVLERQLAGGSLGHAWLLLGPRGSGKGAAAIAMAAAFSCLATPGVGCGRCRSCSRILRKRHPDVHHIVAEGPLIPVDVIREIVVPEAARSSFEGGPQVFVIEEADRMNPQAQNALLKTLEEPQGDTVFILISDDEEELLETIRSRCRIVRLEPVPEDRVIAALEREGAVPDQATAAARVSEGDLQGARELVFDDLAIKRRAVWASIPRRLLSPVAALDAAADVLEEARAAVKEREGLQRDEVIELTEAMGEGRGTATARNALAKRHRRELKRLEEDVLGEALSFLASFYRDVVAARAGASGAVTNADRVAELEGWARSELTDAALMSAAERCVQARASFSFNANKTLAVESTLVCLTRVAPPAPARSAS